MAKTTSRAIATANYEERDIPVDQLRLDVSNPRLASAVIDKPTQQELVELLWNEMSVDEVAFSIAANGYYRQEPLLVLRHQSHFTVIEGNRRLAAVMLLRDAKLRERVGATDLPALTAANQRKLDKLPVFIYPDRRALWAYLGFRHVNGTRPWDAFSKAKYVADVCDRFGVSLTDVARKIGDRHSTVQRLYQGYKVLMQAESKAGFDRADRVKNRFYFSHLYTAVDQPEFQRFLGITPERWTRADPVPKSHLTELSELMLWMYGRRSTDTEPVVRHQNPDLNLLRTVIGKPAALSILRTRGSLDAAYEASIGDSRRFRDSLTLAKEELQKAKGTVVTGYRGEEDLLDTAEGIVLTATSILEDMRKRRPTRATKAS